MKGYNTSNGYMGYVEGKYILFASEQNLFYYTRLFALADGKKHKETRKATKYGKLFMTIYYM